MLLIINKEMQINHLEFSGFLKYQLQSSVISFIEYKIQLHIKSTTYIFHLGHNMWIFNH
jgi:hypothetical protein